LKKFSGGALCESACVPADASISARGVPTPARSFEAATRAGRLARHGHGRDVAHRVASPQAHETWRIEPM
jgi:hypothetical protein